MLTTDNKIVAEIIKRIDEKKFNQAEKLIDELGLSYSNIIDDFFSYELDIHQDIMRFTLREALFVAKGELEQYSKQSNKNVRIIDYLLGAIMSKEYNSVSMLGMFSVANFFKFTLDKRLKKAAGIKTTKEYTDFVYSTLKDMKHKKVLPWMITQIMV